MLLFATRVQHNSISNIGTTLPLVYMYFETTGPISLLVDQNSPRVYTSPSVGLVLHEFYHILFYYNFRNEFKFQNQEITEEASFLVFYVVDVLSSGFSCLFWLVLDISTSFYYVWFMVLMMKGYSSIETRVQHN